MEASGQHHTPADLQQEKNTVHGRVGPTSRSGYYRDEKNFLFLPELKTPGQPGCSLIAMTAKDLFFASNIGAIFVRVRTVSIFSKE